jgi:hypothetical protein
VVNTYNEVKEGVIIYINEMNNKIELTYNELEDVYGILNKFNFQNEINKILLAQLMVKLNMHNKHQNIWDVKN